MPIRKSNIFHEIEFWNRGNRNFAPYPKEKKNISEFIDLKCESVEIKEAA